MRTPLIPHAVLGGEPTPGRRAPHPIGCREASAGRRDHTRERTMYRLSTAGCVLALGLLMPVLAAEEKAADNPAAKKLNRDVPRHKEFLKRIEQSNGVGDVIFLGDSITHGWEGQKA